jgi:dienelactone hydrolase
MTKREVFITGLETNLAGELALPDHPQGLVVFAHGSGSSRFSPRNQFVAGVLQGARMGTLLFDLLTEAEEREEYYTRHLRFDIPFLARRLVGATRWLQHQPEAQHLRLGYFGSSTGAAAALMAAAELGETLGTVVSRGGRPDLAAAALEQVRTPTLLMVGGRDLEVLALNRQAFERLRGEKELRIIPGATHLFEEPGALEQVAETASEWFQHHLQPLAARA